MGGSSSGPFVGQSDARQQTLLVGPSVNTTAAAHEVEDETTVKSGKQSLKTAHHCCARDLRVVDLIIVRLH